MRPHPPAPCDRCFPEDVRCPAPVRWIVANRKSEEFAESICDDEPLLHAWLGLYRPPPPPLTPRASRLAPRASRLV